MPMTVTIADELAKQLEPYEGELTKILELGIREWQVRGESGYYGMSGVLEKLAGLPAISIPVEPATSYQLPATSMPVGFQLIGKSFREVDLLGLGQYYEKLGGS